MVSAEKSDSSFATNTLSNDAMMGSKAGNLPSFGSQTFQKSLIVLFCATLSNGH
jgi:hypothetical protein